MLTNAFSQLLFYRPRGKIPNYIISFVTVGCAVGTVLAIFGTDISYLGILFWLFLAVVFSALVGGLTSGLTSITLSLVIILLYSLIKVQTRATNTREIQTLVFIFSSFITTYIINAVKSAYQITISILNSLQSPTVILNPRGQIVDINRAALKAFEVQRGPVVGRSILSHLGFSYSNDHRRQIAGAISQAREGFTSRFDLKILTASRQTLFFDFSIAPIYDKQKNVISLVVSANDITDRVTTEKQAYKLNQHLIQKFNELETIFKLLPIGVGISYDRQVKNVHINPAYAQMIHVSGPDSPKSSVTAGKNTNTPFKFFKEGRLQKQKEHPMELAASKGIVTKESEAEIIREDGSRLNVLQYAMPIKNDKQEIVGSVGAVVDITKLKAIESKLKESQMRFQSLINANLIGVVVAQLDQEGMFIQVNDAFCTMTGYSQTELKSGTVTWRSLTPPEFRDLDERAIEQMHAVGEAKPYEKEYIRKDGRRLPILIGAALVEPEKNVCVAFILDITARKKLEKRKDEFIGLASHELKTPLTSMKVFSLLLERALDKKDSERGLGYIEKINRQIVRLTALIEELLDVSKIESGQLQLHIEPFNLHQQVVDTVLEIQAISLHHRIKVEGKIEHEIKGDAFRIKQVIQNLLTNAVKYSPQDTTVVVQLMETERSVKVSVVDEGVGVPEPDQKRVFDKFFRAGGKNMHSFPGLGLGLYLSKRIVERHGGEIWLESVEGKGSTFSFTLQK